jgi:chloramphenicol O-acetyltransferase
MRYIINFQVKIEDNETSNEIIRSSYTILEKDSEKYKLLDITEVEDWFKDFFKQTPLDHFIDTKEISNTSNFDMKIGRITNAISGEYKTF